MALAAANAVAMHSGDRGSSSRQALSSLQASSSRQASGGGGVQTRFVTIVRKIHSGWTGVKLVIAALLSFFLFLGVVFCRFKVDILSSRACQVVDWSLESNTKFLTLSLPFSPLTRALESIVPQRSSRYVSLGHLGCAKAIAPQSCTAQLKTVYHPSSAEGTEALASLPCPVLVQAATAWETKGTDAPPTERSTTMLDSTLEHPAPRVTMTGFRCSSRPTAPPTSVHPPLLLNRTHRPRT